MKIKAPLYCEYKTPLSNHCGPWKCCECGERLINDQAAREHKHNTGHSSFKSALPSEVR